MSEQHTYAGLTLDEIKAAAEAATPGPWKTITDEHPHCRGGKHRERRIFTAWEHPQLRDFAPVVNGSVGIPAEKGGKPIHMVSIEANNAAHIATANPATVLAMAARIEELERERDKLRENYDAQGLALKESKAMQLAETQRADAAEPDAARYRWLRDEGVTRSATLYVSDEDGYDLCDSALDTAIDAAMEQTKNREGV